MPCFEENRLRKASASTNLVTVMETKTANITCAACAHWKATTGSDGECRRQPPQAVSFHVDGDVKFETRFPITAESDWCGEFTAK